MFSGVFLRLDFQILNQNHIILFFTPPNADDAKTGGHDAERADRGAEGQRRMEVLARHRHPRSRHPHPRLGAQKVRLVPR